MKDVTGLPDEAATVDHDIDSPDRGRQIGRYVLEDLVGSGAMGVVHRARDTKLGRVVAIKSIREELVSQEEIFRAYRTRFYNEASIFGSLSHPNIVELYDVGESEAGIPYLAMEFVSGASLDELARQGKQFTVDRLMWLFAQLASAIDYAHEKDVIHRDIKPSNVLVGEGDEVKMADFGVAKLLGSEFTRSQTRFGTPGYMSPEQVVGQTITKRADIFSLGVLAFELLSGELPFPGNDVHTILHKLVHADPVVPKGIDNGGLDMRRWESVFGRALSKDPEKRQETASELVSGIVELFPGSWLGNVAFPRQEIELRTSAQSDDVHPQRNTLTLWRSTDEASEARLAWILEEDEAPADMSSSS